MNVHLSQYSYIGGYMPSKCDITLSEKLKALDTIEFINIQRWLGHMRSFSDAEESLFHEASLPSYLTASENINIDKKVCHNQFIFAWF